MPLTMTAEREASLLAGDFHAVYTRRALQKELEAERSVRRGFGASLAAERAAHQETKSALLQNLSEIQKLLTIERASLALERNAHQEIKNRLEQEEVQHAGCLTAAEGWVGDKPPVRGDWGWSPAFQAVSDLYKKHQETQAKLDAAWEAARSLGEEYGISAENLEALICGIGDKALENLAETQAIARELVEALTIIIDLRKNHAAEGGPCDGMCEGCSQCVARTAIARARAKGVLPADPETKS